MVYIEMYTKQDCPLCENAKAMLNAKNVSYNEIQIGRDTTREAVLEKFPGRRTVPIILVDGVEVTDVSGFQLLLEG